MIRRLLPILICCLWASAAAGQTPPKTGLASLPDPGAPDNAELARRGLPSFLEEQCTPRAYLLTYQPIMNCTYWFRGAIAVPGYRHPGYETRYIRLARLDLRRDTRGEEEVWTGTVNLWLGLTGDVGPNARTDYDGVGYIETTSGNQLVIRTSYGDFDLLVNSHHAIVSNVAMADYQLDAPPEPVKLIFQRDGDNFDPAAMIRVD